jgi:hypothetical protein
VRAAGLGVVDCEGVFDDGVAGFTVVGAAVAAVVGAVVAVDASDEFGAAVTPADAVADGIIALMAMPVPSAVATPMLSEAAIARPRGAACGRRPR